MAKKINRENDFELEDGDYSLENENDLSFDSDLDMDFEIEDNRTPLRALGEGALKPFNLRESASDIFKVIAKNALPDSYGEAFEVLSKGKSSASKLYSDAYEDISPTLNALKASSKRLLPTNPKFLPKFISKRIKEFKADESLDRGSSAEDENAASYDEDSSKITSTLQTIFGAQRLDNDIKASRENAIRKADNEVEDNQFIEINNDSKTSIHLLGRLVSYQDTIFDLYLKKTLELQHLTYFALRDILQLTKTDSVNTTTLLEGILKNTGLPNEVKVTNSEMFEGIAKNRLISVAQDKIRNKLGDLPNRIRSNLGNEIGNFTGQLSMVGDTLNGALNSERSSFGPNPWEIVGEGLTTGIRDSLGSNLGKKLKENTRNLLGDRTADFINAKGSAISRKIRDFSGYANRKMSESSYGDGLWGFLSNIVGETGSNDERLDKKLHSNLLEPATWDVFSRRTLVEIIPGFLSRTLEQITILTNFMTGKSEPVDRQVYSTIDESFVNQGDLAKNVKRKIKSTIGSGLKSNTEEILDLIDPDKKIAKEDRNSIAMKIIEESNNNYNFTPDTLLDYSFLSTLTEPSTAEEILKDAFKVTSEGGRNTYGVDPETEELRNKISDKYSRISSSIGDYSDVIEDQYGTGNKDVLTKLGVLDRFGNIDKEYKMNLIRQLLTAGDLSEFYNSDDDTNRPPIPPLISDDTTESEESNLIGQRDDEPSNKKAKRRRLSEFNISPLADSVDNLLDSSSNTILPLFNNEDERIIPKDRISPIPPRIQDSIREETPEEESENRYKVLRIRGKKIEETFVPNVYQPPKSKAEILRARLELQRDALLNSETAKKIKAGLDESSLANSIKDSLAPTLQELAEEAINDVKNKFTGEQDEFIGPRLPRKGKKERLDAALSEVREGFNNDGFINEQKKKVSELGGQLSERIDDNEFLSDKKQKLSSRYKNVRKVLDDSALASSIKDSLAPTLHDIAAEIVDDVKIGLKNNQDEFVGPRLPRQSKKERLETALTDVSEGFKNDEFINEQKKKLSELGEQISDKIDENEYLRGKRKRLAEKYSNVKTSIEDGSLKESAKAKIKGIRNEVFNSDNIDSLVSKLLTFGESIKGHITELPNSIKEGLTALNTDRLSQLTDYETNSLQLLTRIATGIENIGITEQTQLVTNSTVDGVSPTVLTKVLNSIKSSWVGKASMPFFWTGKKIKSGLKSFVGMNRSLRKLISPIAWSGVKLGLSSIKPMVKIGSALGAASGYLGLKTIGFGIKQLTKVPGRTLKQAKRAGKLIKGGYNLVKKPIGSLTNAAYKGAKSLANFGITSALKLPGRVLDGVGVTAMGKKIANLPGKLIGNMFSKGIEDVYVTGESEPRLTALGIKDGKYFNAETGAVITSSDNIDFKVVDENGNVLISETDLELGLVNKDGKRVSILAKALKKFKRLLSKATISNISLKSPMGLISGYMEKLQEISGNKDNAVVLKLDEIFQYLKSAMPTIDEEDKTNNRIGGMSDIIRRREEAKAKKNASLTATDNNEEENPSRSTPVKENDSLLSDVGDMAKTVGTVIATYMTAKIGSLLTGLGGIFSKIPSLFGGASTAARVALPAIGEIAGSAVAGASGLAASTAATFSTAAATGGTLAGLGAVGSAAGMAATGFLLTNPLGWAILAGGAAYAGYKTYKYLSKRTKLEPLEKLRYLQYGAPIDNTDAIIAIRTLEDQIEDVLTVVKGKPVFSKTAEEIWGMFYEVFGNTPDDPNDQKNFTTWFYKRFAPVYIKHLVTLELLDKTSNLLDIDDDLSDKLKFDFINKVQFGPNEAKLGLDPYSIVASPWRDIALSDNLKLIIVMTEQFKNNAKRGENTKGGNLKSINPTSPTMEPKDKPESKKIPEIENAETIKKKEESKKEDMSLLDKAGNWAKENVVNKFNNGIQELGSKVADFAEGTKNLYDKARDTTSKGIEAVAETGGKVIDWAKTNIVEPVSNSLSGIIKKAESGNKGYNAYNRGTSGGKILGPVGERNLTSMTIGSILNDMGRDISDRQRLFAVGKYQMIPSTLKDGIKSLGLSTSALYDEKTQELLFSKYLLDKKRPQISAYIKGKTDNLVSAASAAASEWASIADPKTGHSKYGSGNHASVPPGVIMGAIKKSKELYASFKSQGLDEDSAYQKAVSTDGTTPSKPLAGTGSTAVTAPTSKAELPTLADNKPAINESSPAANGGEVSTGVPSINSVMAKTETSSTLTSNNEGNKTAVGLSDSYMGIDKFDTMKPLSKTELPMISDIGTSQAPLPETPKPVLPVETSAPVNIPITTSSTTSSRGTVAEPALPTAPTPIMPTAEEQTVKPVQTPSIGPLVDLTPLANQFDKTGAAAIDQRDQQISLQQESNQIAKQILALLSANNAAPKTTSPALETAPITVAKNRPPKVIDPVIDYRRQF